MKQSRNALRFTHSQHQAPVLQYSATQCTISIGNNPAIYSSNAWTLNLIIVHVQRYVKQFHNSIMSLLWTLRYQT